MKNIYWRKYRDLKRAAQESVLPSFNDVIDKCYFPIALKQANITPVFKKRERYAKNKDP